MKKTIATLAFILVSFNLIAQVTIGSGSLSYARQQGAALSLSSGVGSNARQGANNYSEASRASMPDADAIIPEDFFNYHKHQITIPSTEDVALSIDYDKSLFSNSNELLVQVGIATQPANLRAKKQNKVNISLVVDVSGSMDGTKIDLVKKALRRFASTLGDNDLLSIVTFSDDAKVVFPASRVGDNKSKINTIIEKLTPDGMTNLNAGMLLGYREALKNHSQLMNTRVILMTDGETNVGETDHNKIIVNSVKFNKEGIEISTIGIGQSLDFSLLRQLADKGKGSNYYIGEHDEDIYKVFDQELDGLLYKIGRNQQLEIKLPEGWSIEQCYGYEGKSTQRGNTILFDLENLGASSTRIALLKVRTNRGASEGNSISARLTYLQEGVSKDLNKQKNYSTEQVSTNNELRKNFEIALMAQTLKDACTTSHQNRSYSAQSSLENTINWMQQSSFYADDDFQRVYKIIEQYGKKTNYTAVESKPYKSPRGMIY